MKFNKGSVNIADLLFRQTQYEKIQTCPARALGRDPKMVTIKEEPKA